MNLTIPILLLQTVSAPWLHRMQATLYEEEGRAYVSVQAMTTLPDGAVVRLTAHELRDRFEPDGARIIPEAAAAAAAAKRVVVRDGRIEHRLGVKHARPHRVTVGFDPAAQQADLRPALDAADAYPPVEEIAVVEPTARQLKSVRDDARRLAGWIRAVEEALFDHADDREAILRALKTLSSRGVGSSAAELLPAASASRFIGLMGVTGALSLSANQGHLNCPRCRADAERLGRPAHEPQAESFAWNSFAQELRACRPLLNRELALWHLTSARYALREARSSERRSFCLARIDASFREAAEEFAMDEALVAGVESVLAECTEADGGDASALLEAVDRRLRAGEGNPLP